MLSGCLNSPLTKKLVQFLFNLASGRFLGQGQRLDLFFAKMSRVWASVHFLILFPADMLAGPRGSTLLWVLLSPKFPRGCPIEPHEQHSTTSLVLSLRISTVLQTTLWSGLSQRLPARTSALAPFPMRDKATQKRQHITGLTVSEVRVLTAEQSHGPGAAEHAHLDPSGKQRAHLGMALNTTPRDTSTPTRPHLLIFFQKFHQLGSECSSI